MACKARTECSPEQVQEWVAPLEEAFRDDAALEFFEAIGFVRGSTEQLLAGLQRPIERALRSLHCQARNAVRHRTSPFDPDSVPRMLFSATALPLAVSYTPTAVLELNVARIERRLSGSTGEERFESYVELLGDADGSAAVLREYPVLARFVSTWLQDWVTSCGEFLERLANDWPSITSAFVNLNEDDRLSEVVVAGDRHRRCRAVLILTFTSGTRLVYKPRPVAVERHFQELLLWMNANSDVPAFHCLSVVDRGTHGWVEFAVPGSCRSLGEIRRFYERQGAYLAVLRALSAVDFHCENTVAMGEHPVLVDLESLFHQSALEIPDVLDSSEKRALELAADSVLRVGFLPLRLWGSADAPGIDMSALGASAGQIWPIRAARWANLATDEMHLVLESFEIQSSASRPALGDRIVPPDEHVDDLITGFRKAYEALMLGRDELLSESGPIHAFARDETRVVFRPTMSYSLAIRSSFHPQALRHGLDRERRFDRLLATAPDWTVAEDIVAAERRDMWRGDIPMFTTRPDSRDIWTSEGERIAGAFEEPGLSVTQRRLLQMNEPDLERQCALMRTTIATSMLNSGHAIDYPSYAVDRKDSFETRDFIVAACEIGDRLGELAIRGESGGATWIGVRSQQGADWTVAPLGPVLYDGLGGISLFLATLGAISERDSYAQLSRSALAVMRRQVERLDDCEEIGAFSGIGGHIYVLTHLSVMLDDPTLSVEAAALAELLPEAIERDRALDVVAGAAGCIVPLLNLHRFAPSDRLLKTAIQCGDHLIASAIEVDEGLAWHRNDVFPRPLGGFAHGAAGCAWALLELAAYTDERRFKDAAVMGIRFERSLFSPSDDNWRDQRDNLGTRWLGVESGGNYYASYWCHGAAGIGLGRLRCLDRWDDGKVIEEVESALRSVRATGFGLNHSLCHGDLGTLDLLLECSSRLDRPELYEAALDVGARVLTSRRKHGWITGHPLGLESPGLMMGLAGIGYGLLRLADPAQVPSVLLLDPPRDVSARI